MMQPLREQLRRRVWIVYVAVTGLAILVAVVLLRGGFERRLAELNQQRYVETIVEAQHALSSGDRQGAARSLESAPPRWRGWEWDHLDALRRGAAVGTKHIALVQAPLPATSPDARLVAFAGGDGRLVLGETGAPEPLITWPDAARAAAFGPGGDRIAIAWSDGMIDVREVPSGRVVGWLGLDGVPATCLTFSPDGSRIVAGHEDGSVSIHNGIDYGRLITLDGHETAVKSLVFDDLGMTLTSVATDGSTRQWTTDYDR